MTIDSIQNGVVIDHITAGQAMRLYQLLRLDQLECSVAMIMNVGSLKRGRKDIIKIDGTLDLDFDLIGYVDPDATVNIIRNGNLVEKRSIPMPEKLTNVIRCRNPRCVTSVERDLTQVFRLTDREKRIYRCLYCESKA